MIFTPPNQILIGNKKSVFLAGTIDMGNSENWQEQVIKKLQDNYDIYNPRREDWDSSWVQEFKNPQFYQQVMWENDGMDKADFIIMNFLPDSKSPITLLELGTYVKSRKLFVCCPDKFYRSGNVHIICNIYNIPLFKDMDSLLKQFQENN